MIELKNSKKTYLGKVNGRNRYALDCTIGACQYKDNLGVWQDIAPKLVRSGNKYVSEGTPYLIEFDSKGGRREYPDRYDLSKYIDLPAIPLLKGIPRKVLEDRIVYTAPKFDLTMGLGKTKTFLEILFREAPAFDKITLGAKSVGLDIRKLLLSKQDLGIPRPRLIDSSEEPIERVLDWSFKSGQLEVGFDMTGLKFPVLFKNSPLDVQVAANEGDAHEQESTGTVSLLGSWVLSRSDTAAATRWWGGFRFVSGDFPASGTTIDVAYLRVYILNTTYDDANFNIHLEELAAPAVFTTDAFDITSRDRTENSTPWIADGIDTGADWYNSPDLSGVSSPVQEIFDSLSPTAIVVITRPNQDADKWLYVYSRDYNDNTKGAILHLEWAVGGVTHLGAATLSGVGTLAADGVGIFIGKATLSGTGSLSSIGKLIAIGKATLSGVGTLAGAGKLIAVGKATLSGVGTLSAIGNGIFSGAASFVGSGTLSAAGYIGGVLHTAKASFTGTGSLSVKGYIVSLIKVTVKLYNRALTAALHNRALTVKLYNRALTTKLYSRTLTAKLHNRAITLKKRTK